jgi:hypothetical protein
MQFKDILPKVQNNVILTAIIRFKSFSWRIIHKTYRKLNIKIFMLNEFGYFGIRKSDTGERKEMWKKNCWSCP